MLPYFLESRGLDHTYLGDNTWQIRRNQPSSAPVAAAAAQQHSCGLAAEPPAPPSDAVCNDSIDSPSRTAPRAWPQHGGYHSGGEPGGGKGRGADGSAGCGSGSAASSGGGLHGAGGGVVGDEGGKLLPCPKRQKTSEVKKKACRPGAHAVSEPSVSAAEGPQSTVSGAGPLCPPSLSSPPPIVLPPLSSFSLSNDAANAPKDTLRSILRVLKALEPERILCIRKINRLGFNSPEVLEAYFSGFGIVDRIMLSHSSAKSMFGRGAAPRVRPAALGFLVMTSAEEAHAILEAGTDHEIQGHTICVTPFGNASKFASENGKSSDAASEDQ